MTNENIEKLTNVYLPAKLKLDVEKVREAKEQKRQESTRLAQELRCVEEKNRCEKNLKELLRPAVFIISYGKAQIQVSCESMSDDQTSLFVRCGAMWVRQSKLS